MILFLPFFFDQKFHSSMADTACCLGSMDTYLCILNFKLSMRLMAQFRKSCNFNLPSIFLIIPSKSHATYFHSFLVDFNTLKWSKEVSSLNVLLVPIYVSTFLVSVKSGISGKIDLLSKFHHSILLNTCTLYTELVRTNFGILH